MKRKYRNLFLLCLLANQSHAATLTWDSNAGTAPAAYDGGGTWTTAASWWNGTANVTWVNGTDIAVFGNTASNPIGIPGNIGGSATAGGITFNPYFGNAVKYNITGGTITLSGTPVIAVNTNPARPFAAINSILAGTTGFDVSTTTGGILEIGTQANTITGAIRLKSGSTLSIGSDTSLGGTGNGLTFDGTTSTLLTRGNMTPAAARPFTINASGNIAKFDSLNGATLILAPTSGLTVTGGTGGILRKEGLGGLTLNTGNTYTGETGVRQGTLTLNFVNVTAPAAPTSNIINTNSPLRLFGGTLSVLGRATTANTQAFNGTTLDPGASGLTSTPGASGTTAVSLGAITPNPGGTLDIATIVAGASYTTTSSAPSGILGGFATINGTDWVGLSGTTLIPYASYQTGTTPGSWASGDNVSLATTPSAISSDITINSLKLTGATTLAIPTTPNTLTLTAGGLLVTSAGSATITDGVLKGSASGQLAVIQNNTATATSISSVIANNGGATALAKSGAGSLVLTGANTYSGDTYLNAGSLDANSDAALGTGANFTARNGTTLTLSGGTAITSSKNFRFDFGSDSYGANALAGTATDVGNFNVNVTNTAGSSISGVFNVSAGTFVKKGAGMLTLTNTGINQLCRTNGGSGAHIQDGGVTFNGGAGSEWRASQSEFVVGTGDNGTIAAARQATVNVQSGTVVVGSWTGIGRGNGTSNFQSKIAMTGGTWDTGNLSLAFANGVAGFAAKPILDLSGNSVFTVRDEVRAAESGGADVTVNATDTSRLAVRFGITVGRASNAKGTFNMSGSSTFSAGSSMILGQAAGGTGIYNLTGNSTTTVGSFLSIGAPGTGKITVQNSAAFTVATDFNVADTDSSNGTLNLDGGTVTGANLYVGKGSNVNTTLNTNGVVNQTGGVFQGTGGNDWRIGGKEVNDNDVYGAYTMTGGSLTLGARNFQVGAYGRGVLEISGTGAVTSTGGYPGAGRFTTGIGLINVGGTTASYSHTSGNSFTIIGENGVATLNLSAGGTVNANGVNGATAGVRIGHVAGGTGTFNMNGGIFNTMGLTGGGGSSYAYLNGGQINATAANAGFMNGITSAIVGPSGVALNTGAFNLTITQPLKAATLSGVATIPVTLAGTGYMGQPIVQITGGGGTGASAIATRSGGTVTGITITSPGTGYTSAPTVSLIGGGATTAATLGAATLATVAADGGLTKSGAGTLTLSGGNTYIGGTVVNNGTLALGASDVLANTGAVTITGSTFNLAGSSDTVGAVTLNSGSIIGGSGSGLTATSFAITNTTGTTTISSTLSGFGASLTKSGAGDLVLSGSNFYSGTTNINGGKISLGSTGQLDFSSSLSMAAGGTFDIQNGTASRTVGVTDLTLTGGTLVVGVAGTSTDVLSASGTATANGTITVKPVGSPSPGYYNLIQTTGITGSPTFVLDTSALIPGFNSYLGTVSGNNYQLQVTGNPTPGTAYWTGLVSSIWSDSSAITSSNWSTDVSGFSDAVQLPSGGSDVVFLATTSTNTTTTLGANFSINSLTFSSGTSSVTGGAYAMTILGLGTNGYPLEVQSGADVTLNTNFTFTQPYETMIQAGGSLTFGGGSLGLVSNGLIIDGTFNVNTDLTKNKISGSGVISKSNAGTATLTVGDAFTDSSFSGNIQNTSGTLNFTKVGNSKLTLSGSSSNFSGVLKLSAGSLELASSGAALNPSVVTHQSGATLITTTALGITAPYSFDLNGGTAAGVVNAVNGLGNYNINVVTGTTTLSGLITNSGGSVAKKGAGTLEITNAGANVLTSGVGTLAFVVQNGGVVLNGGATATYGVTGTGELDVGDNTPNSPTLTLTSGTLNVGSYLSVARGTGTISAQPVANLNGGTLNVPNLYSGFGNGVGGYNARPVINVNGSTVNVTSVRIGESTGSVASLNLNSGAFTATGIAQIGYNGVGVAINNMTTTVNSLQLGAAANGVGAFYNNGTLNVTSGASLTHFPIGNGTGSYGYFRNNTGGSTVIQELGLGGGTGGGVTSGGVLDVAGGSVGAAVWLVPNRGAAGQSALLNVTGGIFNTPNSGQAMANWTTGQYAHFDIRGTGSLIGSGASSTLDINHTTSVDNTGLLTLGTGGTVQLASIRAGATSGVAIVTLNGGTLRPSATTTTLLDTTLTGAYVQSGGAVIDTATFDATVPEPLLSPAGQGVNTIPLTTNGAGYVGRPIVRISGDGVGATAVANFDPLTGDVTGITVTSPGSGYTTPPLVNLIGGGGTTTAVVGTATLAAANTTGGLTKSGTGKLTLSAANTYTGNTTVNAGTLALADNAQMKFVVGANGVNNSIGGSATLTLDGDFVIDTTGAAIANNNSWTLVNVGSLSETFSPTFTVAGYAETSTGSGVWKKTDGLNTWTFTTSDGILKLTTGSVYDNWAIAKGLTNADAAHSSAKGDDPDKDGATNLAEFAFNGDPLSATNNGLHVSLFQDTTTPAGNELTYIVAVRDGVTFGTSGLVQTNGTAVDGLFYTVQGSLDLNFPGSAVSHIGSASDTAPGATGLPNLTGTAWEYHTFRLDASEGLTGKGFIRAKISE